MGPNEENKESRCQKPVLFVGVFDSRGRSEDHDGAGLKGEALKCEIPEIQGLLDELS